MDALLDALRALAAIAGPIALCAVILHALERVTTSALLATFGRPAVLVTGWLGTPIHELSHAALCPVFGHTIVELKLFQPSSKDGTLGYVRHGYNPHNPWAVIGNAFIGLAPLFGGSLALWGAARWLVPDLIGDASTASSLRSHVSASLNSVTALATYADVSSWRFWVFTYVVLCVGSHLAPSGEDLRGALPGGALLLLLTFAGLAVARPEHATIARAASVVSPMVGILALAVALCAALHVLALGFVATVGRVRGVPLLGFILHELRWYALAIGAGTLGVFTFLAA